MPMPGPSNDVSSCAPDTSKRGAERPALPPVVPSTPRRKGGVDVHGPFHGPVEVGMRAFPWNVDNPNLARMLGKSTSDSLTSGNAAGTGRRTSRCATRRRPVGGSVSPIGAFERVRPMRDPETPAHRCRRCGSTGEVLITARPRVGCAPFRGVGGAPADAFES